MEYPIENLSSSDLNDFNHALEQIRNKYEIFGDDALSSSSDITSECADDLYNDVFEEINMKTDVMNNIEFIVTLLLEQNIDLKLVFDKITNTVAIESIFFDLIKHYGEKDACLKLYKIMDQNVLEKLNPSLLNILMKYYDKECTNLDTHIALKLFNTTK